MQTVLVFVVNGHRCNDQQKQELRTIFGQSTRFGREGETAPTGWGLITIPVDATSDQIDERITEYEVSCRANYHRFFTEQVTVGSLIAAGGLVAICAALFLTRRFQQPA